MHDTCDFCSLSLENCMALVSDPESMRIHIEMTPLDPDPDSALSKWRPKREKIQRFKVEKSIDLPFFLSLRVLNHGLSKLRRKKFETSFEKKIPFILVLKKLDPDPDPDPN